jgi:DNA polymerase-3 subunit delta
VRFSLFNKDLEEKDLAACYFLYGEETWLASEFLGQLVELLVPPEAEGFSLERFHYEDTSWPEVIDLARTAPFLFSPWRVIALEFPPTDRESREEGEGKGRSVFSETDESVVGGYLAGPADRTVLVVVLPGRANASRRIVKFFAKQPEKVVVCRELKPLKGAGLQSWIDRRMAGLGKSMTAEAKLRLVDLVGNDLRRLSNELDKLAAFAGQSKTLDEDDVAAAAGWTKVREGWELESALEARDARRALVVLANFFVEGKPPELVLAGLSNFFRGVLAAREGLREGRDRKEIFREVRPQIRESYGGWYFEHLKAYFSFIEGLTAAELDDWLKELGRIDFRLKTGDVSTRADIEAFIVKYCRRPRPGGVTSRPGRR